MKNPKAIVFDLDGTLIHSAPDLHAAANAMLGTLGRSNLDLPTVISFIGNGVEVLVERTLNATGGFDADLKKASIEMFLTFCARDMVTLTHPYPGVVSALEAFQGADVPMGICTNKPTTPAREICDHFNLTRFFDVIEGAEQKQPKKPSPKPLFDCIAKLGVLPSEALYVGDSEIDFLTARNAGVPFRLFALGYLNAPLPELAETDRFAYWASHGISVV